MKKILIMMLALTVVVAAGAKEKKPKKDKKSKQQVEIVVEKVNVLKNDVDSMSYALAVNIATDLQKNMKTLPNGAYNTELFLNAFNAVMKGDSVLISPEVSQEILQQYFTAAQEKIATEKRAEGTKFLTENAKNPAVQTTASGLQYIVLNEAIGPKPQATDKVRVHYEGTLIDGTKFDSSYDRGEPIDFPLNQVIPGWTEGIQLMSVGSKCKFFIPYELGYGEQGAGGVIPPYATLIFTVELLEINPAALTDQVKELEIK
ncbi:MAG: FKBP-type peptidyl-prolyl cis-trans isomerase [Paludibacter sp.]|nr:FKBP-type peptidyl-prolyl cis-trans isomerase [Paludibacter sp.]MDD4199435.1 FKBP-type peptidyl-prolyl cis-trans isomerase [Paludibacter sp.]MDD4427280.1 FKBP-type peptidyl-prolyl cis-trans isomerase [Paludibacter sp.]